MNIEDKIEGKKIILRSFKICDAKADSKIGNDLQVRKYISGIPENYNIKQSKKWIASLSNEKDRITSAISEKKTNNLVGTILFKNISKGFAEIVYSIGSEYSGKGYGTEAVKLMIDYGFNKLNLEGINALVNKNNFASQKILEKVGFSRNIKCSVKPQKIKPDEYLYCILKK